jgi:TATA-box binding protein (TBP) (component of TFIID and TFIIIB)
MDIKLRLSTITATSKFSDIIDLDKLYLNTDIDDTYKFLEYGEKYKGDIDKKNLKKRDKGTKKFFYNQITFHLFKKFDNISKKVNIKLFNNGSIQMTGIKSESHGKNIVNLLFNKIKDINKIDKLYKTTDLTILNYSIAMINTDFDIGFKINREKLNRYMINKNIYTSYEPCIYPGVLIKYYYKKDKDNGICNCCNQCDGTGKDNTCKKITIAVFNSGKIIITGGNNLEQCNKCFDFIKDIIITNKDDLIDKAK